MKQTPGAAAASPGWTAYHPMQSLLVLVCLVLAGCAPGDPAPMERLTIAAGKPGSVYYDLGAALAEEAHRRWSVPAEVLSTMESVENLRLVAEGKADAAFATVDVCAMALQGDDPFRAALPLVALAGIYEDYLQIVVKADSPIKTVKDLKDREVSTGPPGSGTDIVAGRILKAAGMSIFDFKQLQQLSVAEAAGALRTGQIDAFFVLGGMPTPAVAELAKQVPIRILSLPAETAYLMDRYVDVYLLRSIPVGVYGLDAHVVTVGIPNAFVVRADMPDATAYRLTRLLFEAKPHLAAVHREARRLDQRSAIATFSLPMHPGAISYYRDAKPMAG